MNAKPPPAVLQRRCAQFIKHALSHGILLTVLALWTAAGWLTAGQKDSQDPLARRLQAAMNGALSGSVGYAFVWKQDDAVLQQGASGWARAPWEEESASQPMAPQTRFHIASISKTATAAALLVALERNGRSPDDPIDEMLGDDFSDFAPRSKQLTPKRVLNHTSGFDFSPETLREPFREHLAELLQTGPPREPGGDPFRLRHAGTGTPPADEDRAVYSNVNFWLARALLEDVTGLTYEQAVTELLLKPMGISGWSLKPEPQPRPLGYSRWRPGQPGSNRSEEPLIRHMAGPAGWHTDILGLGAFATALAEGRGISPQVRDLMFRHHMGVQSASTPAGKAYYHDGVWLDGGQTGFESGMVVFPNGVTAAAMVNTFGNWWITQRLVNVYKSLLPTASQSQSGGRRVVELQGGDSASILYWTTDETLPLGEWTSYEGPIEVDSGTKVTFAALEDGRKAGFVNRLVVP
ncbi:MAG TPA: serine hydrolase [Acidobacteriota bacterium]|nr:serine hydrolase [Acidobacteriota bacterium]